MTETGQPRPTLARCGSWLQPSGTCAPRSSATDTATEAVFKGARASARARLRRRARIRGGGVRGAADVARILGIRAKRPAAGRARDDFALAGRLAVLDPLAQQREPIDAARYRGRLHRCTVAVDRRRVARESVPGLRQHVEAREAVERPPAHLVEHRLVIVELLAGRRDRVVGAYVDD